MVGPRQTGLGLKESVISEKIAQKPLPFILTQDQIRESLSQKA